MLTRRSVEETATDSHPTGLSEQRDHDHGCGPGVALASVFRGVDDTPGVIFG